MQDNNRCGYCGAPKYGRFCNICGVEHAVLLPAQGVLLKPKKNGTKIAITIFFILASIALFVGGCAAVALTAQRAELIRQHDEYLPEDSYPYAENHGGYTFGYTNQSTSLLVEALQSKRIAESDANLTESGRSYFVVTLRLTNIGEIVIPYDASTFEVCNTAGNLRPSVATDIDEGTALGSGRLLPQGTIEGTVVFMLKTNERSPALYIEDEAGEVICFPLV